MHNKRTKTSLFSLNHPVPPNWHSSFPKWNSLFRKHSLQQERKRVGWGASFPSISGTAWRSSFSFILPKLTLIALARKKEKTRDYQQQPHMEVTEVHSNLLLQVKPPPFDNKEETNGQHSCCNLLAYFTRLSPGIWIHLLQPPKSFPDPSLHLPEPRHCTSSQPRLLQL